MRSEEQHLARPRPEAKQREQEEVGELVGADDLLRLLGDGTVATGRNELGRDRRLEDVPEHLSLGRVCVVLRHPGHQTADERLGDARVDVVHRDVVAREGGEAEGELGEVPCADDDAALLVGQVHEDLGALPGLQVLEGDALAILGIEPDVADVLLARRADVDLPELRPRSSGQSVSALARPLRRAEGGHRHRKDAAAVEAQQFEGPHRDQKSERRVEPPREAEHDALRRDVLETAGQPCGLDREDLPTALVQRGRVGGDEGVGVDDALEAVRRRGGDGLEGNHPIVRLGGVDRIGERCLPRALHAQALGVDVRDDELPVAPETLSLGQEHAVLRHHQVAVENEVGRRLVHAGVGVDVAGQGAARLLTHQLPAVVGLRHEHRRRGGVEKNRGPGHRMDRARRDRGPEVLADLHSQRHPRLFRHLEKKVDPEGHGLAGEPDVALPRLSRRREPSLLVVLPVAGQVGLGNHTQQLAALEHGGRVEQPSRLLDREAHDHDGRHGLGLAAETLEGALGPGDESGQTEEEVAAGVAGEAELGQDHDLRPALVRLEHGF